MIFFMWIDEKALDKSVKTFIKMQELRNGSWKREERQAFCDYALYEFISLNPYQ